MTKDIIDPVGLRASVNELEILFPTCEAKKRVMRFDVEEGTAAAQPISTIYIKREAWAALGAPQAVRLTIEPA